MSGWLRGIILAAVGAAGADILWQKVRHDTAKGPAPPLDTQEAASAAVAGGALAGLYKWATGRRRW